MSNSTTEQDNAGLGLLGHGVNIVVGEQDHRHHRSRAGDGRDSKRKNRQVAPRLGRPRFRIQLSEEHLQTEEEKDDPACNFERVQVNADGIENDLPRHHCDDKNDRRIDRSPQSGATPLRAGKGCPLTRQKLPRCR